MLSFPPLEVQSGFTGCSGQSGHAASVQVTAAVKDDVLDAGSDCTLSHKLAHQLGSAGLGLLIQLALDGLRYTHRRGISGVPLIFLRTRA